MLTLYLLKVAQKVTFIKHPIFHGLLFSHFFCFLKIDKFSKLLIQ